MGLEIERVSIHLLASPGEQEGEYLQVERATGEILRYQRKSKESSATQVGL